jgi:hypothetical protein
LLWSRQALLKGNGPIWRYADRPNAAKRLSLYIVVRVLESEAFAIPESQPDAIAEGLEKVVLAVASWIGNAKALDLVKQVIS